MSSPAPSPSPAARKGLPWIVQPGTYEWIDHLFDKPIKQWGVLFFLIMCCILLGGFIVVMLTSSSDDNKPLETFSTYIKGAMRKKLVNLTL